MTWESNHGAKRPPPEEVSIDGIHRIKSGQRYSQHSDSDWRVSEALSPQVR